MEINLELVVEYTAKLGHPITVNVNVDDYTNSILGFQKGKYRDNSSSQIYLEFKDITDILLLNNITGENGKIKHARNAVEKIPSNERGQHINELDVTIEKYIYETLSKYIVQMLNASKGQKIYPEIKTLEKHNTYFKN